MGQLQGIRVQGSGFGVGVFRDSVEHGVECGVVVHLELAIELESTAAGCEVCPELLQTGGEVVALGFQDSEPLAVPVVMLGRGRGAVGFFGGVEDFEREDGEAVNDEAGGFRVERKRWVELWERREETDVDALDEIVAELVERIDITLAGDDGRVGGLGVAGGVFAMPEIEVGAMLVEDKLVEFGAGGWWWRCGVMPEDCGVIVQEDDMCGRKHIGRQ